ncbi:MAG: DUF1361 domain-containing protein [Verrucomicrobiaceae bacterium]|nr:DUF1361 domain-containing protein [Verrucomicrobiaceae bacterium]
MSMLQSFRSRWPVLRTLVLGTFVCCALLVVRCLLMHGISRAGICANIFLAWVPCLLAIPLDFLLARRPVRNVGVLLLGVLWLLFLPNAAYIVTDLVHWTKDKQLPRWFDWIFVTSCAWVGLFLGYESIVLLHRRFARTWSEATGWSFVVAACILSSAGIYFGRFMRWNSWDVVRKPAVMIGQLVSANFAEVAAFCVAYSVFTFTGYCMLHGVAAQARRDVSDPSG